MAPGRLSLGVCCYIQRNSEQPVSRKDDIRIQGHEVDVQTIQEEPVDETRT